MSDLSLETILADCGVDLATMIGGGEKASAAFVKVHAFLVALYEDVKRTEDAAKKNADGTPIDPPHVKAWKADKAAAKKAAEVAGTVVKLLEQYEGNSALTFHLRENFRTVVGKYLATEVEYAEWKAERAAPAANVAKNTRQVNSDRYKVGKEGLANLFNLIGHTLTLPSGVLKADGGKMVPNLPGMPGNYGGNGASASGRYALLYRLTYKVDGKSIDDPREVVRAIWQGADRIGKSTADLFTAVEKKVPDVTKLTAPVVLTLNGKNVTVIRKAQ